MQHYVANTTNKNQQEIWITEHPPTYTTGCREDKNQPDDFFKNTNIKTIKTDRGGLTTYHGIGQVIFYCLLHLPTLDLGIKKFVFILEQSVIDMLANFSINAQRISGQPGVYVKGKKIASLGVKITKGWSYHGIACNFNMDLSPFKQISPCGYKGLEMCNIADFTTITKSNMIKIWQQNLCRLLNVTSS